MGGRYDQDIDSRALGPYGFIEILRGAVCFSETPLGEGDVFQTPSGVLWLDDRRNIGVSELKLLVTLL